MKKNKTIIGIVCLVMLGSTILLCNSKLLERKNTEITIEGTTYAINLDGRSVSEFPSSNAYLMDYKCEKNSILNWDHEKGEITLSGNTAVAEKCTLNFKTNPLLSEMKQGSYVAYEGNNGCMKGGTPVTGTGSAESGNSCLGYNANDTLDTSNYTYGYCARKLYSFFVKGWKIAYKEDERVHLISAGSPECIARTESAGNVTYINEANTKALKYCNTEFVDGACDNTNAWAMGDNDFNKITAQITGTSGGYLFTSISGATKCGKSYSKQVCGYNNDLIDNGSNYMFAANDGATSVNSIHWDPYGRVVQSKVTTDAHGLRPIIRLSTSVYVTGGSGTMDDPYTIAK